MSPVPVFTARVRGGKIQLYHQPEFESWLRTMEGRDDIEVIVHPRARRRSLKQNAYYHVIVELIAEYTGYTHKRAHELMKDMFMPLGAKSTAALTRVQFRGYCEEVELWATGWLGIRIMPRHMTHVPSVREGVCA